MTNRFLFDTTYNSILPEHRTPFRNFLLGALVASTPEHIFAQAMKITVDCMHLYGPLEPLEPKAEQGASNENGLDHK